MSEILLTTLNSTYQHSSFGLRYLRANLKTLKSRSNILEFTINQNTKDIAEKILLQKPLIVGFGVYIWNTKQTEEVIRVLKKVSPELIIVLGGPEVSHETQNQSIVEATDYVIKGEADFLFHDFCWQILITRTRPHNKIISGDLPQIDNIQLPYDEYVDEDIHHRVLYVEASRGCPYKCEYCLSSLDKSVRNFPIDSFLNSMEKLILRGGRQFKFVDRTFNLSPSLSTRILKFFLDKIDLGLFLHFEMVPDRLPDELKNLIEQFPQASLQFEVGVQTWNPAVAANVSRRQDYSKIEQNFKYLRAKTKVHTHADLIVGLPGETLESFGSGFDALSELGPDEIQVGILKRLKGTPIARHDQNFSMVYQDHPPFQILQNRDISFVEMQFMTRFAKFWDLYANSGHFLEFMSWLKELSRRTSHKSFFNEFKQFVIFLNERHKENFGISLIHLFESAWLYSIKQLEIKEISPVSEHFNSLDVDSLPPHVLSEFEECRSRLARDFVRDKKRDLPAFLKSTPQNINSKRSALKQDDSSSKSAEVDNLITAPKRQSRRIE